MAGITLRQALSLPVVTGMVSTVATPLSLFQRHLGMLPGGPNVSQYGGREFVWDIYDKTRKLAKGRGPANGPATSALQIIKQGRAGAVRLHEKEYLAADRLFRLRGMGQGYDTPLDPRGQEYLDQQTGTLGQKFRNAREFMVASMLKGGFDLKFSGDDWLLTTLGSGDVSISSQIPAGNLSQLDMLGEGNILGDWSNAATEIITDLFEINRAMTILTGRMLTDIFIDSIGMTKIQNNTQVKATGGTANTYFQNFDKNPQTNAEGLQNGGYQIVLKGFPQATFHVYDGVFEIGATNTVTPVIPTGKIMFLPAPVGGSVPWTKMLEGSEIVMENVMDDGQERFGMAAWTEKSTQPAGWEIIGVDNALPVLYNPAAVAYGTSWTP